MLFGRRSIPSDVNHTSGSSGNISSLTHTTLIVGLVICGDFNSSPLWDKKGQAWNHSACVHSLRELGLISLYHHNTGEAGGEEKQPTFYMQRNLAKPYHIDYVFAHETALVDNFARSAVGKAADWLSLSDHMPITFDV